MSLSDLARPYWEPSRAKEFGPYYEVWFMKLNDPASSRALWIRFTLMITANGFKKHAETWAVFSEKVPNREVMKLPVKQVHDLTAYSYDLAQGLKIGECLLDENRTQGLIQSKGNSIQWDLTMGTGKVGSFNLVPDAFSQSRIVKNRAVTVEENLQFSGTVQVNGETYRFENASGMLGHLSGHRAPHSWIWGHCNLFTDDQGKPAEFTFEGLTARAKVMGGLSAPRLSSFFFHYQGKPYAFNSVWSAFRARSKNTLTDWHFEVDRLDISFRGHVRAEHKDFLGLAYEDTNGSLFYCANSKLSDMTVHVYRRGKIENTFKATSTVAFEIVDRKKNPYVPIVI